MNTKDTPIFVKSHDLMLWVFERTQRFPKSMSRSLSERIENLVLDLDDTLVHANCARGPNRIRFLKQSDEILIKVRRRLRFAHDMRCLSSRQFLYAIHLSDEVGRLLGAWLRATEQVVVQKKDSE